MKQHNQTHHNQQQRQEHSVRKKERKKEELSSQKYFRDKASWLETPCIVPDIYWMLGPS